MRSGMGAHVWALALILGCGGGTADTPPAEQPGDTEASTGAGDDGAGETMEPILAEPGSFALMELPMLASPEPAAYVEGREHDDAAREQFDAERFEEAAASFLEAAASFRAGADGPQGDSLSHMADLSCKNAAAAHANGTGGRLDASRDWVVSQSAECSSAFEDAEPGT